MNNSYLTNKEEFSKSEGCVMMASSLGGGREETWYA